jgi:hypothetical protein
MPADFKRRTASHMSNLLDFAFDSALGSTLSAAVIGAAITWLWKKYRNWSDSKKIYDFLLASKTGTGFIFRSTEAISSHTQITENRVAELCSKHKKIKRNEEVKQSWQLIE